MNFRAAKPADLAKMGNSPSGAAVAIAAEIDGVLVGVGGVYFDRGKPVVFSSFVNTLTPRQIVNGAKEILKLALRYPRPIYAISDDNDKARRTLQHFNFQPLTGDYWVLQ